MTSNGACSDCGRDRWDKHCLSCEPCIIERERKAEQRGREEGFLRKEWLSMRLDAHEAILKALQGGQRRKAIQECIAALVRGGYNRDSRTVRCLNALLESPGGA